MPTPEGGYRPGGHDHEPRPEQEPFSYHRAARFDEEEQAAHIYAGAQDAIRGTPCDLSVFRLLIDQVSHVVVIGAPPPDDLDRELESLLAPGEAAELPAEVLSVLSERRRRMGQMAPWVERHRRPGPPM